MTREALNMNRRYELIHAIRCPRDGNRNKSCWVDELDALQAHRMKLAYAGNELMLLRRMMKILALMRILLMNMMMLIVLMHMLMLMLMTMLIMMLMLNVSESSRCIWERIPTSKKDLFSPIDIHAQQIRCGGIKLLYSLDFPSIFVQQRKDLLM